MTVTGARVVDELAAGEVALRMDLGFFRALLGGGVIQKWGVGSFRSGVWSIGPTRGLSSWGRDRTGVLPAALPVALLQSPFHVAAGMIF